VVAERANADRIELCVRLDEGGITPPLELIRSVKRAVAIPVCVLVRPRAGDFVYSVAELATMGRDIESAIAAGADGIVTGALTREGRVDVDGTQALVRAAHEVPVTFHRAFDHARDMFEVLEKLVELGAARVLTSGGAASATEGAETIAALVTQSGERLRVVAAGAVRAHNVGQLLRRTHVREVHARFIDEAGMRELVEVVRDYGAALA
jgi:copper homeostasis protein